MKACDFKRKRKQTGKKESRHPKLLLSKNWLLVTSTSISPSLAWTWWNLTYFCEITIPYKSQLWCITYSNNSDWSWSRCWRTVTATMTGLKNKTKHKHIFDSNFECFLLNTYNSNNFDNGFFYWSWWWGRWWSVGWCRGGINWSWCCIAWGWRMTFNHFDNFDWCWCSCKVIKKCKFYDELIKKHFCQWTIFVRKTFWKNSYSIGNEWNE